MLAAGVLLAALALIVVGPAQGRHATTLRVLATSPVRLAGSGFSRGESVRVQARTGGAKRSRRVHADSHGRFRVTFARLAGGRCASLVATATGADGHRASVVHRLPECAPR
jgi:hypothetical protein